MKKTYKEIADIFRGAREKHLGKPVITETDEAGHDAVARSIEELEMEIAHVFAAADAEFSYTGFLAMCKGGF